MSTEIVTEQAQAPLPTGELPAIESSEKPPRRRFRLTLKLLIFLAVAYYFVVPLAPEKDFLKRQQYGGFVGGPIQRNKTFFFVGWQDTDLQNVGTTKTATVPTAEQRAGNFGSTRREGSADRPAVPEQSDSGLAVRSGVGERAEVHAGPGRRRPHPDPAHGSDSRTISSS